MLNVVKSRRRRKPVDEATLMKYLARRLRFRIADLEAARVRLELRPHDFPLRYLDFANFAHDFGLDVRDFAEYIASHTSGVKRWVVRSKHSSADFGRINTVMQGGDWPEAILRLLDELEARGWRPPKQAAADPTNAVGAEGETKRP